MGSPVWSCGGAVFVANAHKGKVKLTFAHGAPARRKTLQRGPEATPADDRFSGGDGVNERALKIWSRGDRIQPDQIEKKVPAAARGNLTKAEGMKP